MCVCVSMFRHVCLLCGVLLGISFLLFYSGIWWPILGHKIYMASAFTCCAISGSCYKFTQYFIIVIIYNFIIVIANVPSMGSLRPPLLWGIEFRTSFIHTGQVLWQLAISPSGYHNFSMFVLIAGSSDNKDNLNFKIQSRPLTSLIFYFVFMLLRLSLHVSQAGTECTILLPQLSLELKW